MSIFEKKENYLLVITISSVIFGIGTGILLKYTITSPLNAIIIGFPGEILMNMLKMLIIPLLVSSLVRGLSGLDAKSSSRMGLYTIMYYIITTICAIIIGIALVLIINPGESNIKTDTGTNQSTKIVPLKTLDTFFDLIRNIFPDNLIVACFRQISTKYVQEQISYLENGTRMYENVTKAVRNYNDSTNILGLVTFSMAFGLIIGRMGENGQIMRLFFEVLNDSIMQMIKAIMWYAPIGIFFLIVGKILEMKDLAKTASSLGWYILTVTIGLIIHGGIVLNIIFLIFTKRNPLNFLSGIFHAILTALGTASSSATLPVTYKCLEENNDVDKRVTAFVLPIGATINMDGNALYEAVASIFIAQINNIELSIGQLVTISITSTLAAIGASSIPNAGLLTMILVLSSVNLPVEDVSLLITVDWLLDRLRTSVNVICDAYAAAIIESLSKEYLDIFQETTMEDTDPIS